VLFSIPVGIPPGPDNAISEEALEWRLVGRGERWDVHEILLWTYVVNAVLLINHEIDSAYRREWDLFKLPGGIAGFLLLHFPVLGLVMYGLVAIIRGAFAGLICSLILACGGIFAFTAHAHFIKKGRGEFKNPMSLFILISTLAVSMAQLAVTVILMATPA